MKSNLAPDSTYYYAEMFADTLSAIHHYPKEQSKIVEQEFQLSINKLSKLNEQSLALFCASRFNQLSRKMQEKKLAKKENTTNKE